jgi:hypothetical protein
MKSVLALSLTSFGAGWAFGKPDAEKPFSGFLTFGSNVHTDDELWRGAQREVLASILHHCPQIVAVTAVPDDARSALRLYPYQVIVRAVAKAKIPGAAKLVKIGDALETLTGSQSYRTKNEADSAAAFEAQQRGWLDRLNADIDRALALAVWCHQAAQQNPHLAFKKGRAA